MQALIFDCDGVLVDTERDGHRVAFNLAFKELDLDVEWDTKLYGDLLQIAGGKERMKHYFNSVGWPDRFVDHDEAIRRLHELKTDIFMNIIESGELQLRPGIKRLIDEAIEDGMTLAVCSTSNQKAVNLIVGKLLGEDRKNKFAAILAGDVVSRKKPDPAIYNLVKKRLNLGPASSIVIEDSRNGLLAAKSAGMKCVITTNGYTEKEDFKEADLVVPELGDPPNVRIDLNRLKGII